MPWVSRRPDPPATDGGLFIIWLVSLGTVSFRSYPDWLRQASAGPPGPVGGYGRSRLARLSLVISALMLAAVFSPVPQASAAGGEVEVEFHGDSFPIHLDDLGPADKTDKTFKINGLAVPRTGHSLGFILGASAPLAGFEMVRVVSVDVDANPGDRAIPRVKFDDPIFFGAGGGTTWIMSRGAGLDAEVFNFGASAPVIRVTYGAEYQVGIAATPAEVGAGDEVRFKARIEGAPTGEKLTYKWIFADGTVREESDSEITHRFEKEGSYDVNLEVTGPSGGGTAHFAIQVGKTKKPDKEKGPNDEEEKGGDGNKNGDKKGGSPGPGGGTGDGGGSGNGAGTGSGTGGGAGNGIGSIAVGPVAPGPAGKGSDGSSPGASPEQEMPHPARLAPGQEDLGLVRGVLVDPVAFTSNSVPDPAPLRLAPDDGGQGGPGIAGPALTTTGILMLLLLGGTAERLVFRRG